MRIQDIELHTGLDRATIRFYEKEGLVIPLRQENGYRSYNDEDLQMLLKIKLLRQLGVSLIKIKALQKGSADFSQVLDQQIDILEKQIKKDTQAKKVCQEIRRVGAQYSNLDVNFYLQMLQSSNTQIETVFYEPISKEIHPYRRFFARILDITLLHSIVQFLLVVVFRIRPWSEFLSVFIRFLCYLAVIPIEAAFVHFLGTTLGKWVFGIRLEYASSGKLRYGSAVKRTFFAIWEGCGLFLPVWQYWRLYKSYKTTSKGEECSWDSETEIVYTNWNIWKKVGIVVLTAVTASIVMISSLDSVLPKYRGDKITQAEFVYNYQMYERLFDYQSDYILVDDGSWSRETDDSGVIIIYNGTSEHDRAPFEFKLDNGIIQCVSYQDVWQDPDFMDVLPYYCSNAIYAVVGSRPGATYADLAEIEELLRENFYGQFETMPKKEEYNGSFQNMDVNVTWSIHLENAKFIHNGMLYSSDLAPCAYALDMCIEIE